LRTVTYVLILPVIPFVPGQTADGEPNSADEASLLEEIGNSSPAFLDVADMHWEPVVRAGSGRGRFRGRPPAAGRISFSRRGSRRAILRVVMFLPTIGVLENA